MSPPYRVFFLLAALDAMLGVAVWLPWMPEGPDPVDWHRNLLLFGTVPAILAGFLLTALPRWTGRPSIPPALTAALAGSWLCARAVLPVSAPVGLALSAAFMLAVSSIAAAQVFAARDRRNPKVVALLGCFCAGIVLTAAGVQPASHRLAVASLLGLVMVIGGRVTPALTAAFAGGQGIALAIRPSRSVERAAAASAGGALLLWVLAPQHPATGILSAGAAAAQAIRVLRWQGWRSAASSAVTALHVGYGWIAAGFALLGAHVLDPGRVSQAAAVHAWTVGAVGTMSLAVMASMMRKHGQRPFARLPAATASFVCITACAVARLLAEFAPGGAAIWTGASAAAWIAAFALFVRAFRGEFRGVLSRPRRERR